MSAAASSHSLVRPKVSALARDDSDLHPPRYVLRRCVQLTGGALRDDFGHRRGVRPGANGPEDTHGAVRRSSSAQPSARSLRP